MTITGSWMKLTENACSEKYPQRLTFEQNGIYRGEASANAAVHPVWDVGTYQLNDGTISMSTSNDAVINYPVKLDGETITINDPDGCIVQYRKS